MFASAGPSIHIVRLEVQYQVPAALADAGRVKERLDRVAVELLAETWEGQLAALGLDEGAYYFIKHLNVQLGLRPAESSDGALAQQWAAGLQAGLRAAIGARLPGVVIFSGRPEYLAAFLSDLVSGWAWERWYYQEFQPLRGLPLSQAAETALTREGDDGRDALLILARQGGLEGLLALLDYEQMNRVAARCLLRPGPRLAFPGAIPTWVGALIRLLGHNRPRLSGEHSRDLARLYLALLEQQPSFGPDTNLAGFLDELLRLSARIQAAGAGDRRRFFALLADGDARTAAALLGPGEVGPFLARLAREAGGELLGKLLRDLAPGEAPGLQRSLRSNVGGLFLLAPFAAQSGLTDFLANCAYPDPPGGSKAGWLLYVVGLQCLGAETAGEMGMDAGPPLFAGLPTRPDGEALRAYSGSLGPELHAAFGSEFQAFLAAQRRSYRGPTAPDGNGWEDGPGLFSLAAPGCPIALDLGLDATLRPVSAWLLKGFAARLGAFSASSPPYLRRNFLECPAEIELYPVCVSVRLAGCPLGLVLRMAGFDGEAGAVPWLEGRQLEFHLE